MCIVVFEEFNAVTPYYPRKSAIEMQSTLLSVITPSFKKKISVISSPKKLLRLRLTSIIIMNKKW